MATKKSRRPNGDGSIYADKTRNKLVAAVTGPDGRRVTKRFPLSDRQAARDWLVEQQADISRGDYVPRTDVTLGEWMLDFIRTYKSGLKLITISNYYSYAARLSPIAGVPLQDLTPVILQKYFNSLPCAHTTQGRIKMFLSMALCKAVSLQLIKRNPLDQVEITGGAPPKQIEILTTAEVSKILEIAKMYNDRIYALIMTAVYTGLRSGELSGLRWADVDLTNDVIHVTHSVVTVNGKAVYQSTPKTDSSRRDVTIPASLVAVLSALKHRKISNIKINDEYVFKGATGHVTTRRMLCHYWSHLQKMADIPYRKFHALRHTHASQLLAAGVPITEVSRRLGHANPAVTLKIYSHFIPGNDRAVADKVQEIFGS